MAYNTFYSRDPHANPGVATTGIVMAWLGLNLAQKW